MGENRRPQVLVTRELPGDAMDLLRRFCEVEAGPADRQMTREELLASVRGKDGLLCMLTDRIDDEVMETGTELKVISNFAVGYDNIDVEAATRRGILVTNTPGVLTDATADMAWVLLMDVARRVTEGDRFTRSGRWKEWAPTFMLGKEVTGSTLGIIGMGRIGQAVAKRARGFDMNVLYFSRTRLSESEEKKWGVRYVSLHQLLRESDFVSLHVPHTPATHHLIGREELEMMKPTAFLINTARGAVIDEKALVAALRENRIAGAGLDVYENEPKLTEGLAELDNVVLAPHLGSATWETRSRMARLAAENLVAVLQGRRPAHVVNASCAP